MLDNPRPADYNRLNNTAEQDFTMDSTARHEEENLKQDLYIDDAGENTAEPRRNQRSESLADKIRTMSDA
jgi:hypothetical protein